jgi:hypothetical protein
MRKIKMRKSLASFSLVACLSLSTQTAYALPLCGDDGVGNMHCDMVEGDGSDLARNGQAGHYSIIPDDTRAFLGGRADWLEAWTFILESGADFTGAADSPHIQGIAYFRGDGAGLELWLRGSVDFAQALGNALDFDAAAGQVVGDPGATGARQFNNPLLTGNAIGLTNADPNGIVQLLGIAWFDGTFGGNGDSVTISLQGSTPPAAIPEPATLALMVFAAASLRRKPQSR